jgi:hypothetical protein
MIAKRIDSMREAAIVTIEDQLNLFSGVRIAATGEGGRTPG